MKISDGIPAANIMVIDSAIVTRPVMMTTATIVEADMRAMRMKNTAAKTAALIMISSQTGNTAIRRDAMNPHSLKTAAETVSINPFPGAAMNVGP